MTHISIVYYMFTKLPRYVDYRLILLEIEVKILTPLSFHIIHRRYLIPSLTFTVTTSVLINHAFVIEVLRAERNAVDSKLLKHEIDVEVLSNSFISLSLELAAVEPLDSSGDLLPAKLPIVVIWNSIDPDVAKADIEVEEHLSNSVHL